MPASAAVPALDASAPTQGARDRLTRVIVASDFSIGAERALGRVARLPLARGATIEIVHVLRPELPARARAEAESQARGELEQAAAELRQRAAGRELAVNTELVAGPIALAIGKRSTALGAELVVVGSHARRPMRDLFARATPQRVVRRADTPVLVVRLEPRRPYRRPLVATDLDDGATLHVALRLLTAEARLVTVLHAFRPSFLGFASASFSERDRRDYRRLFRREARAGLRRLLSRWSDVGLPFSPVAREGAPGQVIVNAATRRRADLIVLGARGRSGVAQALFGGLAEHVLTDAPCDVLVARPDRPSVTP